MSQTKYNVSTKKYYVTTSLFSRKYEVFAIEKKRSKLIVYKSFVFYKDLEEAQKIANDLNLKLKK